MSYIGKSPSGTGVRIRYYFTQTSGGATSISGTDDNNKTLSFSDGEYVDVYLNGVSLVAGTDYNTTTANTIGGLSALANGDVVEVVVYDIFTVADTVSQSSGGTFNGAVIMSNGLTVDDDGATVLTLDRATSDGTVIDVQKDGSTVGGIGSKVGDLTIGTDDTGLRFYDAGNAVLPYNPSTQASPANTVDLGDSGSSFKDLYLGGNLYIGGTGSANALDDYEYGVFDPDIEASGTAYTSRTISSRGGYYEKVGNAVSVYIYFELSAWTLGSGSGNLLINGLPFAPSTARAGTGGGGGVAFHGLNTGGSGTTANSIYNVMPYVNSSSKILFLTSRDSNSWINVPIADVHIGTIFAVWCQVNYYTA